MSKSRARIWFPPGLERTFGGGGNGPTHVLPVTLGSCRRPSCHRPSTGGTSLVLETVKVSNFQAVRSGPIWLPGPSNCCLVRQPVVGFKSPAPRPIRTGWVKLWQLPQIHPLLWLNMIWKPLGKSFC